MHMIGIPAVAHHQDGVFTAEQARAAGWSARQIRRRRSTGEWFPIAGRGLTHASMIHPDLSPAQTRTGHAFGGGNGVATLGPGWPARPAGCCVPSGAPRDPVPPGGPSVRMLAWAAQLTWPDAVACRRTAAALHGFPVAPGPEVEVMARRRRQSGPRLHAYPRDGLTDDHVVDLRGLHVTDHDHTAVDCLAFLPFGEALDLYLWLWARRELPRQRIVEAIRRRIGRPGAVQLRRLLTVTRAGPVSSAGYRLHCLLKSAGIAGWAPGAPTTGLADPGAASEVTFPAPRVVVTARLTAGPSPAGAALRGVRRPDRYTLLARAGFVVLRVTPASLVRRPEVVITQVQRLVSARHRIGSVPSAVLLYSGEGGGLGREKVVRVGVA
jgi:hypothetical protein